MEFDREEYLKRLKQITQGKPYAWAARHGLPKHLISNIQNGTYIPQKRTRALIEEKTGISAQWLFFGEGPEMLSGHDSVPAPAEQIPALQSPLSEAGQAAGQVLEQDGHTYKPDLLEGVVRGVEEFIRAHDLTPSPDKKAIAISLMYRYALMKGGQLTPKDIADFFKLAA